MDKSLCSYRDLCARGGPGYPMVMFPLGKRKIEIKIIIISQEPIREIRELVRSGDPDAIEQHLRCEGIGSLPARTMMGQILHVIGRKFDVMDDQVYWTHSLKCAPEDDRDISRVRKNEWSKCAPSCINHLRSELRAIHGPDLLVITFGRYAAGAALSVLTDERAYLKEPPMLQDVIEGAGRRTSLESGEACRRFEKPYLWGGKSFNLIFFRSVQYGTSNISPERLAEIERIESDELVYLSDRLSERQVRS